MQIIKEKDSRKVCYMILPGGFNEEVSGYLREASSSYGLNIVIIDDAVWNDDLTPWPAPGVFKKAKPFGGQAESFLTRLTEETVPQAEEELGIEGKPSQRLLAGISLSGLFAVWAAHRTDTFSDIISISGSLWYDGFIEWMETAELSPSIKKVALVLGDREKNSKEKRMATVEARTAKAAALLKSQCDGVSFDLVEGTHFSPVAPRLELAFKKIF